MLSSAVKLSRVEYIAAGVTLHLGDCREILPAIGRVDAVVTDPPYGMGWIPRVNNREAIVGDDAPFDPAFLTEIGDAQIIFGANHFASRLPDNPAWLLWLKHDHGWGVFLGPKLIQNFLSFKAAQDWARNHTDWGKMNGTESKYDPTIIRDALKRYAGGR
jgi:hypothetical protein